ncbi:MAG: ABC transporter ATP-binding protein [Clostridia bacterium]|nr:ABC transporter ATP-binding protein [Clostridia bacterium]MDE6355854.1 ABC transporter ATP-binding protein [Clostridia bacterium]
MIIEITDLKKSFKEVKAVDGVSFKVKEGELFAFLGVNGAGKSTTINIISGILQKDGGKVKVCGYDLDKEADKIKNELGIVFQNSVLDKKMTVYDNLRSRAGLYGIYGKAFKVRLNEISELLDLKDILKRPLVKLSGGQKRRIDIARALFHNPKLLILDEPTTGLDPKTRITVWNVIEKLRKENGLTVFLTTHYMEEAATADYVVILDDGKKVAEGTPHELKNKYANDFIKFYNRLDEAERYFKALGYSVKCKNDYVEVELNKTSEVAALIKAKPEIFDDFEVLKGNMDNVFLKVTGKDIKEV